MKIRHPALVAVAGRVGVVAAKALVRTVRVELHCFGEVSLPVGAAAPGARYAYAVWHEHLLMGTVLYGHAEVAALVSKHADGRILADLVRSTGMGVVAGSTGRGGVEAVRQIVGPAGRRHLVVTPDGPRGPRRVAQSGVVYAASRTGMRVVPVGVGYQKAFRLKSWDRFAVPRPGTRAFVVCAEPIPVAPGLKAAGLEAVTAAVQAALDRVTTLAEAWARTGVRPGAAS